MGLTIKMRIDEHPEHTYVYSTGDDGHIELIPLSAIANGHYEPGEGFAYSYVDVAVPEPVIESLNITANGTYTAEDKVWDVVTVNVEPLLESVTRSYTENGTYTIEPSEGFDGISGVTINIDVPTGGGGDVVTVYKRFEPAAPDTVYTIDLSEDAPQNKELLGFIIRPRSGTWQSIANGGGRGVVIYYTATKDIDNNTMWFKTCLYKLTTSSAMSTLGTGGLRTSMSITPQATPLASVVGYDSRNGNEAIKIYCRAVDTTTTSAYGFASYCPYELIAFYK